MAGMGDAGYCFHQAPSGTFWQMQGSLAPFFADWKEKKMQRGSLSQQKPIGFCSSLI